MGRFLCLYASQVAAAVRQNRYKKPAQALLEAWQRVDEAGYRAALARNACEDKDDRLQALSTKHPTVAAALAQSLDEAPADAGEVQVALQAVTTAAKQAPLSAEDANTVKEALRTNLFTEYGTRREASVVDMLNEQRGMGITPDPGFHKVQLGEVRGEPWFIGGKVDGLRQAHGGLQVVEVKNRVNRLFHGVPPYENVQCQAYMRLVDAASCLLVQCYRPDPDSEPQIQVHRIARDEAAWTGDLVPRMAAFMTALVALLDEPDRQDALLKSGAQGRLVDTWLRAASGTRQFSGSEC